MAEILTDSEIAEIETRAHPFGADSDIVGRLIRSHRALAAERDAAYKTSAEIVETAVKTQDELARRIRTLESACKDTRKLLDFLLIHRHAFISAYKDKINQAVEQLEGAIKK